MTIKLDNLGPEVEQNLRQLAAEEGKTIEQWVEELLMQKAEASNISRARAAFLDQFTAQWTKQQAEELDAALAEMRTVNPEDWK
jgi:hypothetical protein